MTNVPHDPNDLRIAARLFREIAGGVSGDVFEEFRSRCDRLETWANDLEHDSTPLTAFCDWYRTLPYSHDHEHPNCGVCRQCVDANLGIINLLLRDKERAS